MMLFDISSVIRCSSLQFQVCGESFSKSSDPQVASQGTTPMHVLWSLIGFFSAFFWLPFIGLQVASHGKVAFW